MPFLLDLLQHHRPQFHGKPGQPLAVRHGQPADPDLLDQFGGILTEALGGLDVVMVGLREPRRRLARLSLAGIGRQFFPALFPPALGQPLPLFGLLLQ
jgi:hypothetical protein